MFLKYALAVVAATTPISSDTNQDVTSDPYADMIFIPPIGENVNLDGYLQEDTQETPDAEVRVNVLPISFQNCTADGQLVNHVSMISFSATNDEGETAVFDETQSFLITTVVEDKVSDIFGAVAQLSYNHGGRSPYTNAEVVQQAVQKMIDDAGLEAALEEVTGSDISRPQVNYNNSFIDYEPCRRPQSQQPVSDTNLTTYNIT